MVARIAIGIFTVRPAACDPTANSDRECSDEHQFLGHISSKLGLSRQHGFMIRPVKRPAKLNRSVSSVFEEASENPQATIQELDAGGECGRRRLWHVECGVARGGYVEPNRICVVTPRVQTDRTAIGLLGGTL
jgi:hypothetical protein